MSIPNSGLCIYSTRSKKLYGLPSNNYYEVEDLINGLLGCSHESD